MLSHLAKVIGKRILLVEDDADLRTLLREALLAAGAPMVDCCGSGSEAWRASQRHRYDFIILDWKIPELSSLALFNRLKNDSAYHATPILVMSGFLTKQDFALLSEYPSTGTIEKPFNMQVFVKKVQLLAKEARWYERQEGEIGSLIDELVATNSITSAAFTKIITSSPNPLPIALFFGKALRQRGMLAQAEEALRFALQFSDNLIALAELGKVYLQTGQHEAAMEVLTRAAAVSPDHLERLCTLGDLHLQQLDTEQAAAYFQRVLTLDPDNLRAGSGVQLTNSIDKWLAATASIPATYAGILNAIGIQMVRSGAFAAGISHYHDALKHVFDADAKAKLAFNLGLGFLRWQKPREAVTWFRHALHYDPQHRKAERYLNTLLHKSSLLATTARPGAGARPTHRPPPSPRSAGRPRSEGLWADNLRHSDKLPLPEDGEEDDATPPS